MPARVVLADDHALFREALRGLLVNQPDFSVEVVAEAATGTETLKLCRQHQPDVLVLDLSMPELGGLEVLAEMPSASPLTRTLVVSQYADKGYVLRALRLGASGYVPKRALAKDLMRAMRAVLEGKTYLDPSVAEVVVDAAIHPQGTSEEPEELAQLTTREREVLTLIAEGKTAKEVGTTLGISPYTVNRHRANLMEKLNVHGKADLVRIAVRLKLIEI